jgi:hypothetical protein
MQSGIGRLRGQCAIVEVPAAETAIHAVPSL